MIFVTVGHQMPFDRLIQGVDAWALREGREDVVAQIGEGGAPPRHIRAVRYLGPQEFREHVERASAIVGHAGTGTIIAALQSSKPLLVLPRRSELGETRNDHQVATAAHFESMGQILVAPSEEDLGPKLDLVESFVPGRQLADQASPELLSRIRTFLFD